MTRWRHSLLEESSNSLVSLRNQAVCLREVTSWDMLPEVRGVFDESNIPEHSRQTIPHHLHVLRVSHVAAISPEQRSEFHAVSQCFLRISLASRS